MKARTRKPYAPPTLMRVSEDEAHELLTERPSSQYASLFGEPKPERKPPGFVILKKSDGTEVRWVLSTTGRAYSTNCSSCRRLMFLDALSARSQFSVHCPYCGVWEVAP